MLTLNIHTKLLKNRISKIILYKQLLIVTFEQILGHYRLYCSMICIIYSLKFHYSLKIYVVQFIKFWKSVMLNNTIY